MEPIIIHTDGSCHGNPGPGGYAAIIEIPRHDPTTVQGGEPGTTNNRMELTAVIEGLKVLGEIAGLGHGTPVEIRSDSKYVIDAFRQNWVGNWQRRGWRKTDGKPVLNRDLWEELLPLTGAVDITWTWVRGHSGDPRNEECDRLANEEADRAERSGSSRQKAAVTPDAVERPGPFPGNGVSPAGFREEPREDGAYDRGYREGYEAARRDMANALNQLRPEAPENPDPGDPTGRFLDTPGGGRCTTNRRSGLTPTTCPSRAGTAGKPGPGGASLPPFFGNLPAKTPGENPSEEETRMELGTRPGPMVMDRDPRVREALESMLRAADGINDPTGEVPDGELQSHNEARQGEILLEWERLAILTGNGKLAWENDFRPDGERMDRILTMPDDGEPEPEWERKTRESPLLNGIDWVEYHVPGMVLLEETLRSLDDPYTAMGYAMRHLGFAVLQYGLVSDFRPGTAVRGGVLAADRYLWGEIEARCAHRLLHRVYVDLSELMPEAPDLRKSCRQAKVLLTRERARAALALGIDPPPQVTDDLMREEMDHHAWELDPPEPALPEPAGK